MTSKTSIENNVRVLIVVLRPDDVAALGFSLGMRHVSPMLSLRPVKALVVGAGGIR